LSEAVSVVRHDGWASVTLTNTGQRNALTPTMLTALRRGFDDLAIGGDVRVVTLRGDGGVFSSGYAIDRLPDPDDLPREDDIDLLCQTIEAVPYVVVAQIEGVCVGAALDVACACDLRYATADATLGITPARLGLVYSWRGTNRLARVAGRDAARRLLFSGELVQADSRLGRRIVSEIAPDSQALHAAVQQFVSSVARNAPLSIAGTKRVLRALEATTVLPDDVVAEIHRTRQVAIGSQDCREARAAFAERRQPLFTGR
jgi:enoyl-CoA hydratase/carnithine racemase